MNRRHPRWPFRESTAEARPRRLTLVGAVATAVLLAGLPLAGPAFAAHGSTESRGIENACPPGEIASAGFTDVAGEGADQRAAIDCVAAHGVARGTTATTYNPGGTVTRGQMASFVMRTLDRVGGYERPPGAPDAFSDDDGNTHEAAINDAAAEGIVQGLADGSYGAGTAVTRAQMASFVTRTLGVAGVPVPTDAPDAFGDDDGNTHESAINALAQFHVVGGTAPGVYSPAASVTRRQMALFLARALDLLAEKGLVAPPPSRSAPTNVVATAKGATTVNVRWSAPATGTPDGYDIHRRTVATPTTACPTSGYTKVGAVTSPLRQLDDAGLVVDTTYCYRVAARSGTGAAATTSDLSLPSDAARATTSDTPKMVGGVADTTAETVTVTYDQAIICTDASRRQFAYGGATSTAPTKAACSGSTLVLTFANVTRDGDLTYTQDIDPAVRVKSDAGKAALTPQTIAVVDLPPKILRAEAKVATTGNNVTVTYSELVSCIDATKALFSFKFGSSVAVKPTTISGCLTARSLTVVLGFADLAITGPGTLTYTEDSVAERRITDAGGKTALSPESVTDKPPAMVKALATPAPSTTDPFAGTTNVVVTYDQAITCPTGSAPQFTLAGAAGFATTASCTGSTLTLSSFPGAAGDGDLKYVADSDPSKRIKDAASVEAVTPQTIAADAKPFMRFAVLGAINNKPRLTVTYTEAVSCIAGSTALFTFGGASPTTPSAISCSGATVVLDFAAPATNPEGNLGYTAVGDAALRLKDATGNEAATPQTLDVTRPKITTGVASTAADTVTLTYGEALRCPTTTAAVAAQFAYPGATAVPTAVSCTGSTLTLTFAEVRGSGTLTYTGDPATPANRIKDLTGNEALSPQPFVVSDPPPTMVSAVRSSNVITVTWSEPVICPSTAVAVAEQFSYTLTAPPSAKATGIDCATSASGDPVTKLTFASVLAAGGTLSYTPSGDSRIREVGTTPQYPANGTLAVT